MFRIFAIAALFALSGCDNGSTAQSHKNVSPSTHENSSSTVEISNSLSYTYSDEEKQGALQNIALIKAIEAQVLNENLPIAEKFIGPHKIIDNLAEKVGRPNLKLAGIYPGKLLYQSNGTEYKLIIANNGDCFIIRHLAPKRVDPKRSTGPVDCSAYGAWSEGGAGF